MLRVDHSRRRRQAPRCGPRARSVSKPGTLRLRPAPQNIALERFRREASMRLTKAKSTCYERM
jgi:hypothetical protein